MRRRKIYTFEEFDFATAEEGDLVEQRVVDQVIDCITPACMRSDCTQLGEPYSHRLDRNGRWRAVYATFKRVRKDAWMFCGYCFRGSNTEKGTAIQVVETR